MISCEDIKPQIALYLDGELHGPELEAMEQHLAGCGSCRCILNSESEWLSSIHQADYFPAVPESLRRNVENLAERELGGSRQVSWTRHLRLAAAAVLVVGLAWGVLQVRSVRSESVAERFEALAVDSHLRQLGGNLPLEIASSSAENISSWFSGKVDFKLQLPNYQAVSGQEQLYHLNGARLVGFNNKYAAYVAYQMKGRLISLVVTSDLGRLPEGTRTVEMKGLKFHLTARNGLKVITWSDRGLSYALVSDGAELGQQSCIVCHTGAKDRELIDNIRP